MQQPAKSATIEIEVWGEFACFTRPELGVERVSYPVMTPSAARGLLEAVFWKPEFRYEIREIGVLRRGSQLAIVRNEIDRRQGASPVTVEDIRQQRTSVILRDVAYLIRADIVLNNHATDPVFKYSDQFRRRIARGQCHHTPYLGTREFAASFEPPSGRAPVPLDADLGPILFDLAFIEDADRAELTFVKHGPGGPRHARGYTRALFFDARIEHGWLRVPPEKYRELYQMEAGHV